MKLQIVTIAVFLLLACNSRKQGHSKMPAVSPVTPAQTNQGMFIAEIQENSYRVEIECSYFDKEYFTFKSDKSDLTDSNDDGIIISGFQREDKLVLTLIDRGTNLSTAGIKDWTKQENSVIGKGMLFEEGGSISYEISFEVKCQ